MRSPTILNSVLGIKAVKTFGMIFLLMLAMQLEQAHAFDIYPEYQGLSASDTAKFETPRDVDSESQSAFLAYQPLLEWDHWFMSQPRAVDTTVGSLTNQHFLIYTRAKFEAELARDLSFHFVYFAQRDREIDQVRQFFELRYRFWPQLALAAYIDPAHYKRENDLGTALLFFTREWDVRMFFTAHDFTRNEHNDLPDFFAPNGSPYSYGVRAIFQNEKWWSLFGARFDSPTEWRRPQESRIFHYTKDLAFADFIWSHEEGRASKVRLQWDSVLKASEPGEKWRLERSQLLYLEAFGSENDALAFELGAMAAFREWTTSGERKVSHQNLMPHALLKIRMMRRDDGFDHVRVGVTMTDFHSFGDDELIPASQVRDTLQGRLDTRYEWTLAKDSKFAAALTFDLDEFPTFEGGNIWFRTAF